MTRMPELRDHGASREIRIAPRKPGGSRRGRG